MTGPHCAIVGIGQSPYVRGTDQSVLALHVEAALRAARDAGIDPAEIDGVMPNELSGLTAEDFSANLGLTGLAFSSTVRSGGASVISSIQNACLAVSAGIARFVLVTAGRKGYSTQRVSTGTTFQSPVLRTVDEFERPYGSTVAAQWFAQSATRHMYEYGTTPEQLGTVAVTQRSHANLNPAAVMHERVMTLDDYFASPMVTTPFRRLDCSLETDGAAAVIVSNAALAKRLDADPCWVAGIGEGHGYPPTSVTQKPSMTFLEGVHLAGKRSFAMAGMVPADIDCAQLYDGFTWHVLAALEALGFCELGGGGRYVEEHGIGLSAALPVNTHGGLLSEGHVSGMNHVIEAVRQLRQTVEPARQVSPCDVALVSNEGHFHEGSAMILTRSEPM